MRVVFLMDVQDSGKGPEIFPYYRATSAKTEPRFWHFDLYRRANVLQIDSSVAILNPFLITSIISILI